MKKMLMAATVALCFVCNAFAADVAGGESSLDSTLGGIGAPDIAAGVVGLTIAGAIVANNTGKAKAGPIISVDPTCSGSDPLVDGVCVGTTSTVTVTGTGTMTSTTTVPVTFTYTPSV
jgi:hypothetical protein